MTVGKTWFCTHNFSALPGHRSLSEFGTLSQKMFLKRSETLGGLRSVDSLFRAPGDTLSEYDSFTQKVVLKRPFISYSGEASAHHVQLLALSKDRTWQVIMIVLLRMMVLKGHSLVTLGRFCCTHSLFRSPRRQI